MVKWCRLLVCSLVVMSIAPTFGKENIEHGVEPFIVAERLHFPKALLQLPDKRLLVAERDGNIAIITTDMNAKLNNKNAIADTLMTAKGTVSSMHVQRHTLALPDLYQAGQGGLLHIALAPDFTTSKRVLLSYSKGNDENNYLVVMQGIFTQADTIENLQQVVAINQAKDTPVHYGGKLLAIGDGSWLVTTGDGFDMREQAQLVTSQLGKVLRFTLDGKPVSSPPFESGPFIFTMGHRNPQGLVKLTNGDIYLHEHGPAGGDELNLLVSGNNYGWPAVTLGRDYSGATISPFTHYEGMVDPIVNWTPSIAPSSMALYDHNGFSSLKGMLLVTALKAKALYAVDVSTSPPIERKIFPTIHRRLRDVAVGQRGEIYLLTDGENAQLIQLLPPKR